MNDVTVIDRFLDTFSRYIDSGFGLLQGEVAFLTATLIVIDMTIAGLYWAMSHATGQGDDVIAKLLRKVLYVGAFAYIIGNFNTLASIVFRSFAGLGLTATGSTLSMETFLRPGHLAKTGIDAGAPIREQIGDMAGFPEVFVNLDPIVVMFLAWLTVILCFFVLAIQLFITLIEFKLTTLAGFVLVPFALWNKTSFLAEKVLGNVVSSGIKVLVLAVIVGIGSGLFAQFQVHPAEPSIAHALVLMLASLTLLALGIFGPGVATGLISGGPQLGAGAMAGAAMGVAGMAVAVGAVATGVGGAVAAWCRSDRLPPHAPSQIVSYVSAHDNFTLWDKLLLVRYEKPEFTAADSTALAQNRLAAGIYLTSFGLPFLQAGEEFARTKKGKCNSYRSSPALNRLDWERAEKYHALVDYYRGLLALRARFPRLSSTDPHAPDALYFFSLEQPLVGWQLPAQWGDGAAWQALCVFYNPTEISKAVPLPVGRWQMLSDGISSSLWRGPARVYEHEAVLMPYSATIFGQI